MKILTFDIEDWFHLLDNENTKGEKDWVKFESRIHVNMERIFSVLDNTNTKATFLILGWIAEKYPEIVKEIAKRGYEIGSHTSLHQLVYEQHRNEFFQDVERSIKVLEDVSGQKVKIFRAPGFSITEENKWAFEVLYELGIEIDCSVFPSKRAHGGMPSYSSTKPSLLKYNGVTLKEFPINIHPFLGKDLIYSGGGYFRLIPYELLKKWSKSDEYIMSYIHPRDLDPDQPMLDNLSLGRKFKSYIGLKSASNKLERWLTDFEFNDIRAADGKLDWDNVTVVEL